MIRFIGQLFTGHKAGGVDLDAKTRFTRVCGKLHGRPDERFDKTGAPFVVFGLSAHGFGGPEWYNVHATGNLCGFVHQNHETGQYWTIEGQERLESWTDKSGKQRTSHIVRAQRLILQGGRELALDQEPEPEVKKPETEAETEARVAAHVAEYPYRWTTQNFLENHPEWRKQDGESTAGPVEAEHNGNASEPNLVDTD